MPQTKDPNNHKHAKNKMFFRGNFWWITFGAVLLSIVVIYLSRVFDTQASQYTFIAQGVLSVLLLAAILGQAMIYHSQWRVMEWTLIYGERAFVYAKEAFIIGGRSVPNKPSPTHPAYICVTFENTGNTPARNFRVDVSTYAVNGELPQDFSYPSFATELGFPTLVGPKATNQTTVPIDDVVLGNIYSRKMNFFVYGTVTYTDIFDKLRQTQFCFRYNGYALKKDGTLERTVFGPCQSHNCDDENCPDEWGKNPN